MSMFYEEELIVLLTSLLTSIPATLISLATYVLTALALYTVAQRRGIRNPWLAWIPVVNCWILGSVSDQYRYVVHGEVKNKRKTLLTLSILTQVIAIVIVVVVVVMIGFLIVEDFAAIVAPIIGICGLALALIGIAIAFAIIRYMALYDVYKSLDPDNCVLYLVLSILFSPTEPFFLFFNRQKDLGMPPRRAQIPNV